MVGKLEKYSYISLHDYSIDPESIKRSPNRLTI